MGAYAHPPRTRRGNACHAVPYRTRFSPGLNSGPLLNDSRATGTYGSAIPAFSAFPNLAQSRKHRRIDVLK